MDKRSGITKDFINAAGMQISLYQRKAKAQSNKKTVLFLHGYKDASPTFFPIIDLLPENFECLCIDFRGHGDSGRIECGQSVNLFDHIRDLSFVFAKFKTIDLLVGHSMGGIVALLYASAFADQIEKIMLLDSLGAPSESLEEIPNRIRHMVELLHHTPKGKIFDTRDEAENYVRKKNFDMSEFAQEQLVSYLVEPKDGEKKFGFKHDVRIAGPSPYRFSEKAWSYIISSVKAKTFILVPENGLIKKYSRYEKRMEQFLNCEKRFIAKSGHHAHLEQPKLVANWIKEIL